MQLSRCHYCQELHRLYLLHLSYSIGSQVFQPCSAPWCLPKICSRISQACLCISASKSLRWSRYIAMMSRWFALKRTSSSNGKSHSKRTIRVCTSLKTLVTLSRPIIQPMSWSCTASYNGRVLVRLSILSTDRMAIFSLSLNASDPITIQWFLNFYIQRLLGQLSVSSLSKHLTCVSRTYSQTQSVNWLPETTRFGQSVDRPPASNDLTADMYKHETKTHCLNQESQVLRCPWLYNSSIPT